MTVEAPGHVTAFSHDTGWAEDEAEAIFPWPGERTRHATLDRGKSAPYDSKNKMAGLSCHITILRFGLQQRVYLGKLQFHRSIGGRQAGTVIQHDPDGALKSMSTVGRQSLVSVKSTESDIPPAFPCRQAIIIRGLFGAVSTLYIG